MEMRGGKHPSGNVARILSVIIGALCIFASNAFFVECGDAKDDISRFRTGAPYTAARSTSVESGKNDSRKNQGKKRPSTKSAKKGLRKKSSAKGSHKHIRSRTANPDHRGKVGVFTAYTLRTKEGAGKGPITSDETDLMRSSSCVVANNKLRFGTKITIEGIGTCEVRDRIGRKVAANRFDIFMNADATCAKDFGKRKLKYTINND